MQGLVRFEEYSRQEVHAIFSPGTPFVSQRGTWGLHGIVPIPHQPGDYVFFVTYGQQVGDYQFDEGISERGVLSWQSQPKQSLDHPQIQQFIAHDAGTNSIYIFLRTRPRIKYTYLGQLRYLSHDPKREQPVHFRWQILNWKLPEEVRIRMGLELRPASEEVGRQTLTSIAPRYWAFCANPGRYRILDAVQTVDTDWWTTGRSDLRSGDEVVIWQTRDKKGRRGVVAFGYVLNSPEMRSDAGNPFWQATSDGAEKRLRAPVRYVTAANLPLWLGESEDDELLASLSVARAKGGSVFKVTPEQWNALLDAAGELATVSPETDEALESLRQRHLPARGGQGLRGLSGAERRAVELYAMECAQEYFRHRWELVEDVSGNASFDLLCRTGEERLYVEVKGTTTAGESVVLTKKEVSISRQFPYALLLVSEIALDRSNPDAPKASGGRCMLFNPWQEREHELTPIAYECKLDHAAAVLL